MTNSQLPFIKLHHKNPVLDDLLKYPNEWTLLSLIAKRASRTINKIKGVGPRQAFIGDYKSCGLSRQKYRTALANLERWEIITTKPTNRGTIATLCSDDVYNVNPESTNQQINHQSTINQPPANHQPTTNKNIKKKRREEIKKEKNKKRKPDISLPLVLENSESENKTKLIQDIYLAYPKQSKEVKAFRAIANALKEIDADKLMSKVKEYAIKISWKDMQYIPDCHTWMGDKQWKDNPNTWEQPSEKTGKGEMSEIEKARKNLAIVGDLYNAGMPTIY